MKFLKYRNTWAYGYNNWEYKLISFDDEVDSELLEEIVENINDESSWSDKFRGIEYEVIDYPGHEWMLNSIRKCKDSLENTRKKLGKYNALYYKNGGT